MHISLRHIGQVERFVAAAQSIDVFAVAISSQPFGDAIDFDNPKVDAFPSPHGFFAEAANKHDRKDIRIFVKSAHKQLKRMLKTSKPIV